MRIRTFQQNDWDHVWPIVHDVVEAQETFAYDPTMTADEAYRIWVEAPPGITVVAVDDSQVLGTAKVGRNRPGPGSHVPTASFMVARSARGRGVGTALCEYAVDWARQNGFRAMQFNAVVESNTTAIDLYKRLGFVVVGTVPGAFAHRRLGYVGLHVMHRML